MQCAGAAKPGVFKWAIIRRYPVIAGVRWQEGFTKIQRPLVVVSVHLPPLGGQFRMVKNSNRLSTLQS